MKVEHALEKDVKEHHSCKLQRNSLAVQLRTAVKQVLEVRRENVQLQSEKSLLLQKLERHAQARVGQLANARRRAVQAMQRQNRMLQRSVDAVEVRAEAAERSATIAKSSASKWRKKVSEAKSQAAEAKYLAEEASKDEAQNVREQLHVEEEIAREAEKAKSDAEYVALLAQRRADRAKEKAAMLQQRLNGLVQSTKDRTVDEWMQLSADARSQSCPARACSPPMLLHIPRLAQR